MQPSSGIGLSLVNELVKMLHGEIQVESEVKKGSVFKLVLHKGKEIYAQDKNVEYILNDTSEEQETVCLLLIHFYLIIRVTVKCLCLKQVAVSLHL